MNYDKFGQAYCSSDELVQLLYVKPDLDLTHYQISDVQAYNSAIRELYLEIPALKEYHLRDDITVEEFDRQQQANWYMPEEYKTLDIAKWVLDQCTGETELQRVGEELLMFHERDMFDLLRWLKYFVDTMRAKNVLWGVGRGSSVASFVLYKIGVHRINSIEYDLPIGEFLK